MGFYKKENSKMKGAKKLKRAKIASVYMHSRAMDKLFEIERRQTEAAQKIQKAYRRMMLVL